MQVSVSQSVPSNFAGPRGTPAPALAEIILFGSCLPTSPASSLDASFPRLSWLRKGFNSRRSFLKHSRPFCSSPSLTDSKTSNVLCTFSLLVYPFLASRVPTKASQIWIYGFQLPSLHPTGSLSLFLLRPLLHNMCPMYAHVLHTYVVTYKTCRGGTDLREESLLRPLRQKEGHSGPFAHLSLFPARTLSSLVSIASLMIVINVTETQPFSWPLTCASVVLSVCCTGLFRE
ncbi:hypothetical protein V8C44DRAFT_77420 [Trichoderma aethiopicum]